MQDLSLGCTDSPLVRSDLVVAARGLSCPRACRILVPQPGIKLSSPTLQGRFLTTGPPEKFPTAVATADSESVGYKPSINTFRGCSDDSEMLRKIPELDVYRLLV